MDGPKAGSEEISGNSQASEPQENINSKREFVLAGGSGPPFPSTPTLNRVWLRCMAEGTILKLARISVFGPVSHVISGNMLFRRSKGSNIIS